MKKIYLIILAAAVLASCQRDIPENRPDASRKNAVSFAGSAQSDGPTRVSYSEGTGAIKLAWQTTDRIGIYALCDDVSIAANIPYKAMNATSTSAFDAASAAFVAWQDEVSSHDFYAYYPYSEEAGNDLNAIPVSLPDVQTQSGGGNMAHIAEYDFMYAASKDKIKTDGAIGLPFDHLFSVLAIQLTASNEGLARVSSLTFNCTDENEAVAFDGMFDLETKAMTVTPGSNVNSVTLTFASPLVVRQSPVTAYMLISPGHAGKAFEITATVDGQETGVLWTKVVPDGGIPAGRKTTVPITVEGRTVDPNEAIDLSAGGTANTYLVNMPGQLYKFKATVKGNGVARTYEWTNDGNQLSAAYTAADLAIAPQKAALVWHNSPKSADGWVKDSPVEIETVELRDDGYVYFTTPADFVPGNVLLAVFDGNDEILWSWNIWAVEGYDYETEAKVVGSYTIMDRNLGAIRGKDVKDNADPREAAWAIGNYYQWGRKDPFPAAADYTSTNIGTGSDAEMLWGLPTYTPIDALKHDMSSQSWGEDNMMFSNNLNTNAWPLVTHLGGTSYTIEQAVSESVKYPYKWMSSGTNNDSDGASYTWMVRNDLQPDSKKTEWRYLWGNIEGMDGEKSIYDPCPPGWMVPNVLAMGLMNSGIVKSANDLGYYSPSSDLYFPLGGQRQAGFGGSKISGLGTTDDLFAWTSTVTMRNTPFRGSVGGVSRDNSYASAGYQVRCVAEEQLPGEGDPIGDQNGTTAVLMGDSITETMSWPARNPEGVDFCATNGFINKGISGTTTSNMVGRFGNDVIKNDPRCAVITAGTNDICDNEGYRVSIEDMFANIRIMAEWANGYGCQVAIGSVIPVGNVFWRDRETWFFVYKPYERAIELNNLLKVYAEQHGFQYIDYHTQMKDENNYLKLEYSMSEDDGVHPNYEGFKVMMPLLKAAVDAALNVEGQVDTGSDQIKDLDKWNDWD